MNVNSLLRQCEQKHIELSIKGKDQLGFRGPKEEITEELLAELKRHKPEIIHALSVRNVIDMFEGTIVEESRTLH